MGLIKVTHIRIDDRASLLKEILDCSTVIIRDDSGASVNISGADVEADESGKVFIYIEKIQNERKGH